MSALQEIATRQHTVLLTSLTLVEFGSLTRKLRNQGSLTTTESEAIFEQLLAVPHSLVPVTTADIAAGYRLAAVLGQSDTFDSTGHAVAQRLHAEFWVSDRRFAGVAERVALPGVRLIP